MKRTTKPKRAKAWRGWALRLGSHLMEVCEWDADTPPKWQFTDDSGVTVDRIGMRIEVEIREVPKRKAKRGSR